jgi:hypothetical protein
VSRSRSEKVFIVSFICDFEKYYALSVVGITIIKHGKIKKFIYSSSHDLNNEREIDEYIASFIMGKI